MGHYIGIPTSRLQIGADICAVPTADAVATGEVNRNHFIVPLRSLPRFAETTSQGYSSAGPRPLAGEDAAGRLETFGMGL